MPHRVGVLTAAAMVVTTVVTAGCGPGPGSPRGTDASGGAGAAGFPVTIRNCGQSVTLNQPPRRVVLIQGTDVPLLTAVGALDRVVAKAGEFPPQLYTPQTLAALRPVPTIGGGETAEGTVSVSLEAVLAQNPDLVVGVLSGSGVTRAALARAGVSYLASPSQGDCALDDPDVRSVYQQVRRYGHVFGNQQQAAAAIARLRDRVAGVKRRTDAQPGPRSTAAAVYVPQGGRQVTVYGDDSMIDAQLEAVGLANVFGDRGFRRAEVALEEILSRNPDYLIVLTLGDLQAAENAVRALPGAGSLAAVRRDQVLALRFDYTDPPTPFSVRGLEILARKLGAAR